MWAIDRFRRLTRAERRLVARAACSIAAASVGLRVLGLKRMLAAAYAEDAECARHAEQDAEAAEDAEQITRFLVAVERGGRYAPGGTCLTQSLALARMLRRRGIAAEVRVGVRTDR